MTRELLTKTDAFQQQSPDADSSTDVDFARRATSDATAGHGCITGSPRGQGVLQAMIRRLQHTGGNAYAQQVVGELQKTREPTLPSTASDAAPNQTGSRSTSSLPIDLRRGLESISGIDLSAVRVHYNSSWPAELNALAYTQGTDIHVAAGQEKHLPHEAWHAIQQLQGRVIPTDQCEGTLINDDVGLEREADIMGRKAAALSESALALEPQARSTGNLDYPSRVSNGEAIAQRRLRFGNSSGVGRNSTSTEWESEFERVNDKKLNTMRNYRIFVEVRRDFTIHIDEANKSEGYLRSVAKLFSTDRFGEKRAEHVTLLQLEELFPNILFTHTSTSNVPLSEGTLLEFDDVDVTREESEFSADKAKSLARIVELARHRIRLVLHTIGQLMRRTGNGNIVATTIQKELRIPPQNMAFALDILRQIFVRIQNRLVGPSLKIGTLDRTKRTRERKTLGASGPPPGNLGRSWRLPKNDVSITDFNLWFAWIRGSSEDQGFDVKMRFDFNRHLHFKAYQDELVDTLIHELSHATASTRDFAYVDEKTKYRQLYWLQHLSNADTIADIARRIARLIEPEPTLSALDSTAPIPTKSEIATRPPNKVLVEMIEALASSCQDDGVLQVKITGYLAEFDLDWSDVEEFFPVTGRIGFAML